MRSKCSFHRLVVSGMLGFVLVAAVPIGGPHLVFLEAKFDDRGGIDGLEGASAVAVSPDGSHVYAVGIYDDAIAVFSRDATSGRLSFVDVERDGEAGVAGLDGVTAVVVSPDGKHVLTAAAIDDAVAVFSRHSETGMLSFLGRVKDGLDSVDGIDGAYALAMSPGGEHVYVAGPDDMALATFALNPSTGELAYGGSQVNGSGSVVGISNIVDVAVSPDGKHVYAVGQGDDAVVWFSRDLSTGQLAFAGAEFDGVDDADGLDAARRATISPDGKHVYVTSVNEDSLALFSRNAETGDLTFREAKYDGVDGVAGLTYAVWVEVSPNGRHVYTTGRESVAFFTRDATTGRLEFVEARFDGKAGVDGLLGVNEVAVSPDGRHIYTSAGGDSAVAVFLISHLGLFRADLP